MATNLEMGRGFNFFCKKEMGVWSWLMFQLDRYGFYISMKTAILTLCEGARNVEARAIHRSGWVEFGPDVHSTRLGRMTKNWIRTRPNIQVGPDGLGQQFGRFYEFSWILFF